MTEQQEKARFRQAIDHTLSDIQGDAFLAQRVLARAEKGAKPVTYHIPKGIVIALIALLCMGTVAVAVGFNYSADVQAQKAANSILHEKYGISSESLGLFVVETSVDEHGTHVHYNAAPFLPMDRIGEYEVLITEDGTEGTWSHDDKDPTLWESGEPECPYWGEKQLQAYLAVDVSKRDEWLERYLAAGFEPVDPHSVYDTLEYTVAEPEKSDLTSRQVREYAKAAVVDVYGLTEDEAAQLEVTIYPELLRFTDGRRLWDVGFGTYEYSFRILLDAKTGEVVYIKMESGGNG